MSPPVSRVDVIGADASTVGLAHGWERVRPHLARARVTLIVTAVSALIAAYFTARPDFVVPLAKRWTHRIPDLLPFTTYCLVVGAYLSVLIRLHAPRYVVIVTGVLWTTLLFGPGAVVTAGAIGVTAYLVGTWLLGRSGLRSGSQVPAPLALALGYAGLLGVFQAAVVLGVYTRFLVLLVVTIVCALSRARIVAESKGLWAWGHEPMSGGWASMAPLLVGSIQLVYASFPETHGDALIVHLMIPHQIAVTGTWGFDAATYHFATMPKGASWLFAAHYLLAGESAARLFNAGVTFITGWLVFDVARRRAGTEAGMMLAATFLSAPLTFWVVFVMFEDALLTLFTAAAVVLLIWTWRALSPRASALVALAVSAAVATKIQGLLLAVPIALTLGVSLWQSRPFGSLRATALRMAIPVLGIGSVPYAIAWLITGNPLFPFYNAVFHSPLFPDRNFVDGRWIGKASVGILYALTFRTSEFMESLNGGFGFQHALLVPGVLVAVLLVRRAEFLIPAFCGAGMFLVSIAFTQYARYLYPTFPLLAMAATVLWCRASSERWRPLLVCYLCGLVALNVFAYRSLNYHYWFFPPSPFAAQPRAQPAYPAERAFNSIVNVTHGRAARVLYLGMSFGAGLDGTPLYLEEHMNWKLRAESLDVKDVQGLRGFLNRHAVSHVTTNDEMTPLYHPIYLELLPEVAVKEARIGPVTLWRVRDLRIRVGPSSIDFGIAMIGTVSVHTVTVWNEGTADLTLGQATLRGSSSDQYRKPSRKDLCSGTTLPPGGSCTLKVRFKPSRTDPAAATLVVPSDALNENVGTVTLKGTGTP